MTTKKDLMGYGATEEEADRALRLFEILRPGLKIDEYGRVQTSRGEKNPLGIYRIAAEIIGGN